MTPLLQRVQLDGSQVVFWSSLVLVLYTYAGYPLVAAAMARWRARSWLRSHGPCSVSIIMPVHNGAALLPAKMKHLLELDPDVVQQVIVVSDGSTDSTAELLATYADPRLLVLPLADQVGKSEALNQAMQRATSEVLLFIDIRPRLEEAALRNLVSNFADPSVGCVAGELLVRSGSDHNAATSAMGGAYWRYEQWIRTSEAAWDSPVGVYGGFYAIRRTLARPFPAGLILDDMFQPLSIIRQGYRNVLDRSATVVDTWPATTRGEFQRKVRTLAGNFQLIASAPWMLSRQNRVFFQLVSHKLLRLVVPYALLLMVLSAWMLAPVSGWWLTLAVLQTIFWALAALSLRVSIPVFGAAGALLVLNVAAVAGLHRFLFTSGPLWRTWAPTPVALDQHTAVWGGTEQP